MIAHIYAIAIVVIQKVDVDRKIADLTDNLAKQEAEAIFL